MRFGTLRMINGQNFMGKHWPQIYQFTVTNFSSKMLQFQEIEEYHCCFNDSLISTDTLRKNETSLYCTSLMENHHLKKMTKRNEEEKIETENHPAVKFASKIFKVYPRYVGKHFFIKRKGIQMNLLLEEFDSIGPRVTAAKHHA